MSQTLPQKITLDAADKEALDKLTAQQAAVQATFQQFAVAGERRMQEVQSAAQAVWRTLGTKYGFNPENVQYVVEGDSIVPKAVRL